MRFSRLQSAMEYLMTYGWSILLIAIVIAAVYALGVFNNNPLSSSNTCLAQSGFLCTKPVLNSTGILNVTFGESYGTTYTIIGVACTNSTTVPSAFVPVSPIAVYTGSSRSLNFNCPLSSGSIGTPFAGTLWIKYNGTSLNSQIAKVAIVNLKVVTSSPQGGAGSGAQSLYPSLLSVPITLINAQNSGTGNNYQEMLSINSNQYASYINPLWSNVEFTTGNVAAGNVGTILQAWVESNPINTATNTTLWVNLPSGIPAQSSVTIYMDVLAGNVMSASGPTGEAPQLSSGYGKYDNGAKVFLIYVDGNTNPSGFSTYAFMTVTQANGITYGASTINALSLGGNSNSVYSLSVVYKSGIPAQSVIAESSFEKWNSLGASNGALALADSQTASPSANAIDVEMGYSAAYFGESYMSGGTWGGLLHNQGTDNSNWNYASILSIPSNTNFYAYSAPQLYSTSGGYSGTVTANPISGASNVYLGFGVVATGGGWNMYINWARVRSYPPSGVAPTQNTGVAAPSGIVHYLPITLTNSQGTATVNNLQANIIFNAGAYQAYEQNSLTNVEFFYGNGTVIPSWMEGNSLNEAQNSILYTSNSIMYWIKIAPQIPASGGTQIVYLGFASNTVNLLNSVTTGIAPQLYCSAGNCPSTSYAQYDNGASFFGFYDNFAGSTLSSSLWNTGSSGSSIAVNNGVTYTEPNQGNWAYIISKNPVAMPGIYEIDYKSNTNNARQDMFLSASGSSNGGYAYNSYGTGYEPATGGTPFEFFVVNAVGAVASQPSVGATGSFPSVMQLAWAATGIERSAWLSYALPETDSSISITSAYVSLAQTNSGAAVTNGSYVVQWLRVRAYPPSGTLPSTSFGAFT